MINLQLIGGVLLFSTWIALIVCFYNSKNKPLKKYGFNIKFKKLFSLCCASIIVLPALVLLLNF